MTKKIISILCIGLMGITSLCGCQLAKEDAGDTGKEKIQDRLIGFYITTEYLDLMDIDAYLDHNIGDTINGKKVEVSNDYDGKLYATSKIVKQGEYETTEFEFKGIDGIPFFVTINPATDTTERFAAFGGHPRIYHGKFGDGDVTTIEGTIYTEPSSDSVIHYNPVYVTADGQVYLMSGSRVSFGSQSGSHTMTESITTTINGEEKNIETTIMVHYEPKHSTEKLVVKQMNDSDVIVVSTTITKGSIPESVSVDPAAAYIIVENHSYTLEGEYEITREILGNDETYITFFITGNEGLVDGTGIEIIR